MEIIVVMAAAAAVFFALAYGLERFGLFGPPPCDCEACRLARHRDATRGW